MRTLDLSETCAVSGGGAIQDMITDYYINSFCSMFPGNAEKATALGISMGSSIGANTEAQLNKLSSAGLNVSGLISALEKKYHY
ncbi:hypothetical protein FEM41_20775 [Jejubacter calystegiae]|uniref:Uncharacterized protein n=1 Tax=Jejubacter calystegiae TaxID=2579935 RepID=A0A4P8YM43_9ENTR|nr:hypothetical protein [Jejubacter calystegiae]QCT21915.1 hypothetical protein FEM41_20775 [Jejubacter calystegiae]